MYHITGRDDRLYRRLNATYRRRKREAGGSCWESRGKWKKGYKLMDFIDEVLAAGLESLKSREQNGGSDETI